MNSIRTLIVELINAVKWRDEAEDVEAVDKVLTKNGVRYCGWDGCEEQPKYKSGADALLSDFSDFECLDWDVIEEVEQAEDNCQSRETLIELSHNQLKENKMPNIIDYSKECDCNTLENEIANVLRTYFETNDNGDPNERYDPNYSAQQALDDIHELIGEI